MGLQQFLPKSQQGFFVTIDKIILIFTEKDKGTRIAKIVLKKKNKEEPLHQISRIIIQL